MRTVHMQYNVRDTWLCTLAISLHAVVYSLDPAGLHCMVIFFLHPRVGLHGDIPRMTEGSIQSRRSTRGSVQYVQFGSVSTLV